MSSSTSVSVPIQGVSDGYTHGASSFFAMYRFDFMLDQQLRPYIMEVIGFRMLLCVTFCYCYGWGAAGIADVSRQTASERMCIHNND